MSGAQRRHWKRIILDGYIGVIGWETGVLTSVEFYTMRGWPRHERPGRRALRRLACRWHCTVKQARRRIRETA